MTRKKVLWAALWLLACWAFVPTVLSYCWGCQDYFQDWASARNWWEHIPIYTSHTETVPRYLGTDFAQLPNGKIYAIVATVKFNAHPPSSALFYLPLALLPYGLSFVTWNLVSIGCLALAAGILIRELEIQLSPKVLFWLGPLGLLSGPLFEQMFLGQSNAVSLAFLALAWRAQRKGFTTWEGIWLGLAIALKLYPFVLLVIPLGGRRWRALAAALGTSLLLFVLSVLVLGPGIWREYARVGLPEAVTWSDLWPNSSLAAFWRKLFVSQNRGIAVTTWSSPAAFWIGYLFSSAVVGLATLWRIGSRNRASTPDRDYAIAICAMLLLSPTCWPHYFLLTLLPLAVLWRSCREGTYGRRLLVACSVPLFVPPVLYLACCGKGWERQDYVVGPLLVLSALAVQTYALVGLWGVAMIPELGRIRIQRLLPRGNGAVGTACQRAA